MTPATFPAEVSPKSLPPICGLARAPGSARGRRRAFPRWLLCQHQGPDGLRICCEAARKLGYRQIGDPPEPDRDAQPRLHAECRRGRLLSPRHRGVRRCNCRGSAATTVDGKLVDYAMVGMARRVIAWAEGSRIERRNKRNAAQRHHGHRLRAGGRRSDHRHDPRRFRRRGDQGRQRLGAAANPGRVHGTTRQGKRWPLRRCPISRTSPRTRT